MERLSRRASRVALAAITLWALAMIVPGFVWLMLRARTVLVVVLSFLALLACAWLLSSTTITEARDTAAAVVVGFVLWGIGRRRKQGLKSAAHA